MFYVNFTPRLSKKKPRLGPKVSGLASVFSLLIERMNRVETKIDRLEAMLSLLEKSTNTLSVTIDMIDSKLDQQIAKAGKVNAMGYRYVIKVILFGNFLVV